jgi:hypothetical protein
MWAREALTDRRCSVATNHGIRSVLFLTMLVYSEYLYIAPGWAVGVGRYVALMLKIVRRAE